MNNLNYLWLALSLMLTWFWEGIWPASLLLIIIVASATPPLIGVWLALILGVVLDLFSVYPFGIFTIILLLASILIYHLLYRVFTYKSLHSFITVALITVITFNLLLLLTVNSLSDFKIIFSLAWLGQLISQIILAIFNTYLVYRLTIKTNKL